MSEEQPGKDERFDELLGLLLDGEISDDDLDELGQLVEGEDERLDELRRQLTIADQLAQSADGTRSTLSFREALETRLAATSESDEFVQQVMDSVGLDKLQEESTEHRDSVVTPIEPELRWLGSRKFVAWAASVLLLFGLGVGLQSWNMAGKEADPQQVLLYGPEDLAPGAPAAFRVLVRDSVTEEAIPEAIVQFSLVDADGEEVWATEAETDDGGFLEVSCEMPEDAAEGHYELQVGAESVAGESQLTRTLSLTRSFKVMVTTDKPLYQPGQVIHLRALSLANADLRPVALQDAVIEVDDAKGNKVFKKVGKTSNFGLFSADFQLADQVNMGDYVIRAIVGDTTSERSVKVDRYRLPKFKVSLEVDKGFYQPGDLVSGHLAAKYTFGEPVSKAKLKITASAFIHDFTPFATVEGETDAEGKLPFEIRLKDHFVGQELRQGDAFVTLEAEVTDTANHTQKANRSLTVTERPIRIEVFPESGQLVQGVDNTVYVLTAYPDGRPAKTTLTFAEPRSQLETSEAGIAKVTIHPTKPKLRFTVTAEDAQGAKAEVSPVLRIDERVEAFLLRTDRAVYQTGDTVQIEVLSPSGKERLFLDLVKDGRAVMMQTINVENGVGSLAFDLPADLHGTLELRGYRIQRDGNIAGDTKVIQVRRADRLVIEAELDKETYKPAEKALINFVVKRADGEAVPAALGLSGVDEAVFALQEMRPGLERVYFAIQEEMLKPRYEIHAHPHVALPEILEARPEPKPEIEEATVILFAAAEGQDAPPPEASTPFEEKQEIVRMEKAAYFSGLQTAGALLPTMLACVLLLPLFWYAIHKLTRPQALQLDPEELPEIRRTTQRLERWWALGVNLPILGVFLAALIGIMTGNDELSLLFFGFSLLVAIFMVGAVARGVRRLRAIKPFEALPLFRKVLVPLPWVLLLAMGGGIFTLLLLIGLENEVAGDAFAIATLVAVVALALTGGALSIACQGALRRLSARRMLLLGLGRSCIAGPAPLLGGILLVSLFTPMGGVMKTDMAMAEMAGGADGENMVEFNFVGDAGIDFDGPMELASISDVTVDASLPLPMSASKPSTPKKSVRVRRHFPETLLWKPELITDDRGRAQLEVPLADSITTWRLAMSAVSQQGELGSATTGIRVFQDFFVDVDFPVALTQRDQVSVPVAVYNYLDEPQTVRLEVGDEAWFRLLDDSNRTLDLKAREVTSASFRIEVLQPGRHTLTVKAFGSKLNDAVERKVRVEPDGRRVEQVVNGRLDEDLALKIDIPADAIAGANDLYLKIYPGAFSQVMEGLDGVFQMPYGCFEQTSSATYPNVLVLDYLRRNKMAKPEVELKALNYVNVGYQRLLSYEVGDKSGGFEWFGHDPAHNVLTAYGLMEFSDMSKVYEVDPALITRIREWLYRKQGSDGSWAPDQGGIAEGAINAFQGATLRTTAYIAWALAETGQFDQQLGKALDYVARESDAEKDNYTLALCANAFAAAKRPEVGDFIKRLLAAKKEEKEFVYWTSDKQGITFGRGDTLAIETTALVAQAFLNAGKHAAVSHKALAWLIDQKDARGTWHSTQATVHAMRALLAGSGSGGGGVDKPLSITIAANGKLAKELEVTPETSDVYRLISLRNMVQEGENTVALEPSEKGNLAYQVVAVHYEPWIQGEAPGDEELTIDLNYDVTSLETDDTLTCKVKVEYHRPGSAEMTIVDLGIPPGFQVKSELFQKMKDNRLIERFEITGRQVILYFREISNTQPIEFKYEMRAKFPVKAKTPKSAAYQYYEPEIRAVANPVELVVVDKAPRGN